MSGSDLLRRRGAHDSGKVSMTELFFDLIFVFAVTQLSHTLVERLEPIHGLQTLLLFLAVWWLWIFSTWCTNLLDPDKVQVRLLLFAMMLGGLMLSSTIPQAFDGRGWVFGVVFAVLQVGRSLFMVAVLRSRPEWRRNFLRIAIWLTASGILWVIGGLAEDRMRLVFWIAALAVEYVSPALYFWVPGLSRSSTADWNVDGGHMAERCMLFVIIALGESLLVTGATFADLAWNLPAILAMLAAFLGSVAMWWVYFDTGAEYASRRISQSSDPGRIARMAYTYLHLPIVGGIIVSAVADELVLKHPDHLDAAATAVILGGPMLYLIGNALFKWAMRDRRFPPLSHLAGLALLASLVPVAMAHLLSALWLGVAAASVMVMVAVWESYAIRRPGVAGG